MVFLDSQRTIHRRSDAILTELIKNSRFFFRLQKVIIIQKGQPHYSLQSVNITQTPLSLFVDRTMEMKNVQAEKKRKVYKNKKKLERNWTNSSLLNKSFTLRYVLHNPANCILYFSILNHSYTMHSKSRTLININSRWSCFCLPFYVRALYLTLWLNIAQ